MEWQPSSQLQIQKKIVLNPEEKKGFNFEGDDEQKPQKNYKWAKLLARVFGIGFLKCPCGGEYKPLGAIKDQQ